MFFWRLEFHIIFVLMLFEIKFLLLCMRYASFYSIFHYFFRVFSQIIIIKRIINAYFWYFWYLKKQIIYILSKLTFLYKKLDFKVLFICPRDDFSFCNHKKKNLFPFFKRKLSRRSFWALIKNISSSLNNQWSRIEQKSLCIIIIVREYWHDNDLRIF